MSEVVISTLQDKDSEAAVESLTLAMLDLPLHTAVFHGQAREARTQLEGMVETLLRHAPGTVFSAKIDGQIAGVLRMKSCRGRQSVEVEPKETDLVETKERILHWQRVWTKHDPKEHHWHLGPVGVAPDHQGGGIGTALLQHFCRKVDDGGAAAYLETDQIRIVRFYERFGFSVVDESDIFGVRNYFMWRTRQAEK